MTQMNMSEESFNPSKEMTAVPPIKVFKREDRLSWFQPLKGNDSRAAKAVYFGCQQTISFQPLKGNDSRAAEPPKREHIQLLDCFNPSKEMTAVPPI